MLKHNNLRKAVGLICHPTCLVILFTCLCPTSAWFSKRPESGGNPETLESCLCQLKGLIDDCSCSVESIDSFNNVQVYPILNSLLKRDFFRYWKVNLQKPCPFWPDDGRCAMRYCSVEKCEAPPGVRLVEDERPTPDEDCTGDEHLGDLDTTISPESQAGFEVWAAHDSARDDSFCEPEDDKSSGSSYVDLLANPERYTGYAGPSAHRVWSSIYGENCFSTGQVAGSSSSSPFAHLTDTKEGDATKGLCLEKRTFFRAISGLHASINVHLSAHYLLDDGSSGLGCSVEPVWGHNVEEFRRRFDPVLTNGEGPIRLKNLYFLYLMELRAIAKAGTQLQMMHYFTGDPEEDEDVRAAISRLVTVARSFQHFDESSYFNNGQDGLKEEFRKHFRNVTRIMDCVGCDKCKLWGKLQVTGLGTALKILFSGNFEDTSAATDAPAAGGSASDVEAMPPSRLQLTRSEVVALVNSLGRLSQSIYEIEQFRKKATR